MPRVTLAEVNRLNRRAFTETFGQVYEHSPWVAERAWESSPFESFEMVRNAMVAVVRVAHSDEQLKLLNAHPELAGQEARERRLTEASAGEQASASLTDMAGDEIADIAGLNRAYRGKFGFPFIIAARNHTKATILAAMQQRLRNDRDAEIDNALAQVFEIARIRLADMFDEAGDPAGIDGTMPRSAGAGREPSKALGGKNELT